VKADEIFILLLILVCIGAVVASAIHSRKRAKAEEKMVTSPPDRADEELAESRHHRNKRPR
jgi:hypothetical protein